MTLFLLILSIVANIWLFQKYQSATYLAQTSFSNDREQAAAQHASFIREEIQRLLDELESAPADSWTLNYTPTRIEGMLSELDRVDPGSAFSKKIRALLPQLKVDCQRRYIIGKIKGLSQKAARSTTYQTKQRYAREATQLIEDSITNGLVEVREVEDIRQRAFHYIAQVEIDSHIEKAKRFEFKSNLKKALEYYKEALYSAIHDDIEDESQHEIMDWLKAKIDSIERGDSRNAEEMPISPSGFLE